MKKDHYTDAEAKGADTKAPPLTGVIFAALVGYALYTTLIALWCAFGH